MHLIIAWHFCSYQNSTSTPLLKPVQPECDASKIYTIQRKVLLEMKGKAERISIVKSSTYIFSLHEWMCTFVDITLTVNIKLMKGLFPCEHKAVRIVRIKMYTLTMQEIDEEQQSKFIYLFFILLWSNKINGANYAPTVWKMMSCLACKVAHAVTDAPTALCVQ